MGTGLIGASVGMALRAAGWEVVGWDPDPHARQAALAVGGVDRVTADPDQVRVGADLVILAGPPLSICETLRGMTDETLIMDIGGVKKDIVAAAAHLDRFVGTHPMAGREHVGAESASAALFRGAAWIVVGDGARQQDLAAVEEVIETCGAIPVRMSALDHDAAVARISHLPHVLASALVGMVADDVSALDLAAGSFRDLTRVSLSDPGMWTDVLLANRRPISDALGEMEERLRSWQSAISAGDDVEIRRRLEQSQLVRRSLAPPMMAVRVFREDRPGELAAVGRALAASRVDVRDLQLRHGEHGGAGVLTLSVRPGESEALKTALVEEGFEVD